MDWRTKLNRRGLAIMGVSLLLLCSLGFLALRRDTSNVQATANPLSDSSTVTIKLAGPPSLPLDASHVLNPALASFSFETAFFEEFVGNSSSPNQLTKNLLENLRTRTGTPAEVRIGGITADSTFWNASLDTSLFNFVDSSGALHNTTIGPGFWDSVKLLPQGTKVTMNLDLHDLDYQGALSVAMSAINGLPPDQFAAFEIGNEPDHYLAFTPQNYSAIWSTWAKNISSELHLNGPQFQLAATVEDPLWPFDAPGASSQLDCVSTLGAGVNKANVVKSCSEHTYQYSVCDPPRTAVATLPNLVNHTRLAQFEVSRYSTKRELMLWVNRYLDLWQPRIKAVGAQLGPDAFVIGEYNSVSCSGKDGVSNTFGQALWLVDTTLYAASLNVSRMYIHQGGPLALQSSTQLNHGGLSFYDLWYPVQNMNGPIKVFPSYYAYLFVTEAIGHSKTLQISNLFPGRQANGSTITTALGDQSSGQLVAYGFWDKSLPSSLNFPTKLALLNLQIFNQSQAGPRPNATFDMSAFLPKSPRTIKIRRLQAPGADIKEGNLTTWAGQGFASGVASGSIREEKITGSLITVQASEVALVFL